MGKRNLRDKITEKEIYQQWIWIKLPSAFKKLILTTKINDNVDENVNIEKERGCQGCGKTSNIIKTPDGHIRDDKDCSI